MILILISQHILKSQFLSGKYLKVFYFSYFLASKMMGPMDLSERSPSPARLPYSSDKHSRQALESINLLRKHRELCDVVLIVAQRKIFAHRVILSACSPYFHAMFTGELAESRQTEVS